MAKSFLSLLKHRRTISDFLPRPVPKAALDKILDAGRWAPSFKNFQPWEFVVVKNKETIDKILQQADYGFYRSHEHKFEPPLVVVLVLKKEYWEGQLGFPNRDKPGIFEAYISMAMPALCMALEAKEQGVASSFLSVTDSEVLRLIGGREVDLVPLIICLGYEKPGLSAARRRRKAIEQVVSYERCGCKK
ncbi:MAG: nitroreductase family protein [Candidatus Micrarchaeota archaeon]|nr:nitroreductase family protein [Candidatus Micrarchaeota archaeon]